MCYYINYINFKVIYINNNYNIFYELMYISVEYYNKDTCCNVYCNTLFVSVNCVLGNVWRKAVGGARAKYKTRRLRRWTGMRQEELAAAIHNRGINRHLPPRPNFTMYISIYIYYLWVYIYRIYIIK